MSKKIYGRELMDLAPGTRVKVVDTGSRRTNEAVGHEGVIAPGEPCPSPSERFVLIPWAQQQGVTLDQRVASGGWVPAVSVDLL